MADNIPELKPCPFCGSARVKQGGDDKVVGVWCENCQASGPNGYLTINGEFDWNTRAAPKVKPLVWEEWGKENGNSTVWRGHSGAQFYKVVVHCDGSGSVYDLSCMNGAFRVDVDAGINGVEFYKAAAQADYESRILSALQ